MRAIRGPKDFWAGVLFMAFGAFAMIVGSGYTMGTAARMGPGYFPRMLGGLLVVLGALVALRGLRVPGRPIPRFHLRSMLLVLGTVIVFGLVVSWTGILLGTVALIVATSYASHEFRLREALISGVILAVAAVLVFVVGLKLQLPIWPYPWSN